MINLFSKYFLLCIWTDVDKVRIFNLQCFFTNTMATSQSWQYRAAGSLSISSSLNHISGLRWHISSNFDRNAKSWAHSHSKIIGSTTSLKMRKLARCYCFCHDFLTTIFHLLLAGKFFEYNALFTSSSSYFSLLFLIWNMIWHIFTSFLTMKNF